MGADKKLWEAVPGWDKANQLRFCRTHRLQWRARELYVEHDGNMDKVLDVLCSETGWTVQEAYIFTDKMFSVENWN